MEDMFRAFFERLIQWVVLLTMLGAVTWWTIDLQEKAAAAKATGLVSLTRINRALFAGEHRHRR
jgi:hypothetical protein